MDTKKVVIGRYYREPLRKFLTALNLAAVKSRTLTQTERAIRKVEYSIEHDFKDGFAPRSHGLDAQSLARRELDKLNQVLPDDLKRAELDQVRAQLVAAETLVAELQRRVTELDHSRGSMEFIARQREIQEARARANAS